jgi:hypothetical protein
LEEGNRMLARMDDIPAELTGLRATGTVSREDYERVMIPLLEEARQEGQRIRLLFQFDPEFEGFTPAAAWEDLKVGWRYLGLFERCAVVSDHKVIRTGARILGAILPCPVRVFGNGERQEALAWLRTALDTSLDFRMLPERGVVIVEPKGKLSAGDFDALEAAVDDWIDTRAATLNGLVIHVREFPGWEDLGSAWRHIRFVRGHHRRIPRVAFASNSRLAVLAETLAQHFLEAKIERFDWDALDDAIDWASEGRPSTDQATT